MSWAKPWALAWLCALALVGLATLGQREFFYRDVTRQYEPVQAQVTDAWSSGRLPLWNASTQAGVPLWANPHAAVLSPLLPFFLLLPFHLAYAWAVALCLALGALGVYLLLRGEAGNVGAVAGAATFVASGVLLSATSYLPLLAGAACVPFQLLAVRHAQGRFSSALALLFAAQVLVGDPSTAVMGIVACVAVAPSLASLRTVALSGLAALGLSAVIVLPAATLYAQSARADDTLSARMAWSFHPARVLEWVVRRPYGGLLDAPFFMRWDLARGPDAQPFLLEHGWGFIALLSLGAGVTAKGRLRAGGLALVLVGAVLSSGEFLFGGSLHELPPLRFFRFPERYGVLTSLGAALLAAQGVTRLWADERARQRWALVWVALAGVALATTPWLAPVTAQALRHTVVLLALAAVAGWLLARRPSAWLVTLAVLALVDVKEARDAAVLTLPREVPQISTIDVGGHRVWRDNQALRQHEGVVRGTDAFVRERANAHATFASATPGLHGVDELGGYSPVALSRWRHVVRGLLNTPNVLFKLFDVCALVSGAQPSLMPDRSLTEFASLYRLPGCGGRAWVASRVRSVANLDEALRAMTAPDFNPLRDAVLESPGALPALSPATVELKREAPGLMTATLSGNDGVSLVLLSEAWAPGWTAHAVDQPLEVLPVDGALLGVFVPPGARVVTLQYQEPLLPAGFAVSVATALVMVLLTLRRRADRQSRR